MTDIGLFIVDGCIAPVTEGGDFKADEGLSTAVLISLFSDRRVSSEDELPPGVEEKRGWWGDVFPEVEGDQIGSKLWTLAREKITLETVARIESFTVEALQWMIDDKVASSVEAEGEIDGEGINTFIRWVVRIQKPDGGGEKFAFLWDGQEFSQDAV